MEIPREEGDDPLELSSFSLATSTSVSSAEGTCKQARRGVTEVKINAVKFFPLYLNEYRSLDDEAMNSRAGAPGTGPARKGKKYCKT